MRIDPQNQEKTLKSLSVVGKVMAWFFVVTWVFTMAVYVWQTLA